MIKFPYKINENNEIIHDKNRGMTLEKELNETNAFYLEENIAIIHKKATPINVVKCINEKIVEAYFDEKSTTDYCGLYNGYYIDFEAKSTISKTSFPLANIRENQLAHAKKILSNKGVSFFIIEFSKLEFYFVLPTKKLLKMLDSIDTSSISLELMKKEAFPLKRTLTPPLDYIKIIKDHLDEFLL